MARTIWRFASIALLLIATGCSKQQDGAPVSTESAAARPLDAQRTACGLVTAADMSSIVGTTVSAEGEEGVGTTTCTYRAATGSSPYVEMKIDWGTGASAMTSAGILGRREPGISDPLAGLGDEASAIGPALWVRVGDDLVHLTLWGLDDDVRAAKTIVSLARSRMGPSAQAKTRDETVSDDAAKAGAVVSGLLDRLSKETERSRTSHEDRAGPAPLATRSTLSDEASYGRATGLSIRIPLMAGLTLVGAEHEPGRGDYEPIVTISSVTGEAISTIVSANLPEGTRLVVNRDVLPDDMRQARAILAWYEPGDPKVFKGTTAFSLSTTVYNDLKNTGQAQFDRIASDTHPLTAFANLVGGSGDASRSRRRGMLQRVEPHALAYPVLLNEARVELHAIHARGVFDDATIDYYVLDDPANPLLLRVAGESVGGIVRIAYSTPNVTPIERSLEKDSRVALHGVYFDFGKATIRPESEPVLRDIANALTHNPAWRITIEGHTDHIGNDAANLELSRRRADAVKQALVERHRIAAARLMTAGFGASRPTSSNDTLSGRARNRRVELVRR